MKQIVFDEYHDEAVNISDEEVSGYFSFACELGNIGYQVRTTEKMLSDELESTDVLVVAFPKKEFFSDEIKMIKEFVENGGGLFLIGEWANLQGVADCLNGLSAQFGVIFKNNRLTDFDDKYKRTHEIMEDVLGPGEMPFMVKLVDFEKHPITSGIKSIGYLAGCTLDTDKKNALVWTDASCFADHRIDQFQQISEEEGPFILAAKVDFDKGRIVAIGDSSPFSNRFLQTEDNKKFGVQILKWLSHDL
jgi:uncharacterized membrane protein